MTLKLASGSYDNTIRFWNPSDGTSSSSQTIKLSSAPNRIQITQDKKKIVVGMNNSVKIYDLNKPQQPFRSFDNEFKGNVTSVGCFWKQDKLFYTGCEDGYLKVFDMNTKTLAKSIKHNKPINCAALHPNQGSIVTGDQAGVVLKWDLSTQAPNTKIETEYSIRSIAMSQSMERMVIGDSQGYINCYSEHMLKTNQKPIKAHQDYILKVLISPNNKYMASCSADKKIKLFKTSLEGDKFDVIEHATLKGHLRWVWDCQFSCDSAYLISCSTDMSIKLWEVDKGELVQTLKGHQKGVICLALNDIAQA